MAQWNCHCPSNHHHCKPKEQSSTTMAAHNPARAPLATSSFGLQWWWFDGQWQFHWAIWAGLPLLGALLVTLAGQGMRRQLLAGTLSDRLRGLGQGLL